ncbi:hypothetical protein TNCV_1276081 [Trichonephila clavipes]|nr:hypothetical protein TNCV_1276081 [Trichonephila clavipes]
MPFGLSGAAPNFQKAIDIILKSVIGRFVSVYMDDVIITSPSFNEHLDHLNQGRVVVYRASTPQVLGSINGLGKVDSAFNPRYIGSINEYQAYFGS